MLYITQIGQAGIPSFLRLCCHPERWETIGKEINLSSHTFLWHPGTSNPWEQHRIYKERTRESKVTREIEKRESQQNLTEHQRKVHGIYMTSWKEVQKAQIFDMLVRQKQENKNNNIFATKHQTLNTQAHKGKRKNRLSTKFLVFYIGNTIS